MKKHLRSSATSNGIEARWFMILPVAALAFGCDSNNDAQPSAEPAPEDSATQGETTTHTPDRMPADNGAAEAPTASAAVVDESDAPGATPSPSTPSTATGKHPTPVVKEPKAEQPLRRGAAVQGEGFSAWLEGSAKHELNEASSVQVVLNATEPFKCNEEYPYRFTAAPSPGVSFQETTIRNMNIGKQRSTMTIPFTPKAAGAQTVSGELSFSVCTDDKCLIEKQPLSIVIDVAGS